MTLVGFDASMGRRAALTAMALASAAMGLGASCIILDPDATLCAIGSLDCECTPGGACDGTLVCDADRCIDPDAPITTGSTGGATDGTSTGDTPTSGPADSEDSSSSPTSVDDTGMIGGPNFMFVTSTLHAGGSLGGLAGADGICQARADEAGLDGSYIAWLSLPGDDARDRVGDARGWVRPDGRPVADDLTQLLSGVFYYPPRLDEQGTAVIAETVWTGTTAEGIAISLDDLAVCGGWADPAAIGNASIGDIGAGISWWTQWASQPCTNQSRLLCLGVDRQADVVVEPVRGRLAFVSAGYIAATAGRPAADALCQNEGAAVRPGGTFLALMAETGAAPADRFDASGAPWVRADGVQIFPDGQAFAPALDAHISLTATGEPTPLAILWAGSFGAATPGEDANNCTNWSSNAGFALMFSTYHAGWQSWSLGGGSPECAEPGYPVICLQQ